MAADSEVLGYIDCDEVSGPDGRKCGAVIRAEEEYYSCTACSLDLCQSCVNKRYAERLEEEASSSMSVAVHKEVSDALRLSAAVD